MVGPSVLHQMHGRGKGDPGEASYFQICMLFGHRDNIFRTSESKVALQGVARWLPCYTFSLCSFVLQIQITNLVSLWYCVNPENQYIQIQSGNMSLSWIHFPFRHKLLHRIVVRRKCREGDKNVIKELHRPCFSQIYDACCGSTAPLLGIVSLSSNVTVHSLLKI